MGKTMSEGEEKIEGESTFASLGLSPKVMDAVKKIGYENPTPIQMQTIPLLLAGKNLLGTAQTGTGKTAAFTLPLLSRLNFGDKNPAMLVLTPTRELAIQVSEAIQKYSSLMKDFHVVPVYGGQDMGVQLRALKRKANVVVATPGRLIDHLERRTIDLSGIQALVLDEADEMLDMGFQEDVEYILEATPEDAQRALFSATMPTAVQKIVSTYLGEYETIRIAGKTATVEKIRQRYLSVRQEHKMEALTRVLEGEEFEGMLIFVRTKQATAEIAERLEARGFNAVPLSGDLAQSLRERTLNRLKDGKIDIVVATDVAARGLDVERITHVLNYDIPYDTESYVHRIGRTGRAGRDGNAILFVTPRETRLLAMIEKETRQKIEKMSLPTGEQISDKRVAKFKEDIIKTVQEQKGLDNFKNLVENIALEQAIDIADIAAALAFMTQEEQPLFPKMEPLDTESKKGSRDREAREPRESRGERERPRRGDRDRGDRGDRGSDRRRDGSFSDIEPPESGMERYYLGVGRMDNVSPRDIVGAIANEADLDSKYIGHIKLFEKFSTVDLPEAMPEDVLQILRKMTIKNRPSKIRLMTDEPPPSKKSFDGEGRKKSYESEGRKSSYFDKKEEFGSKRARKPFRGDEQPQKKTRRFGRH
ncbi:MAG: DEAD/DEAH box helicase [Fibromonadaceae bacterium]|jgi:ATP-dependent RNA helicase DeaD|nr:DEAD/DEAH box helicase [Fibromonadaceae bacterium]